MASFQIKFRHVLVFLSLMTVAGIFMLAEDFHRDNPSVFSNATKVDFPHQTISGGSYLLESNPTAIATPKITATTMRRGVRDRDDGGLKSLHFGAFGHPSAGSSSIYVTTNNPATVTSWSSRANLPAASTFKTIFTGITTIISEDLTVPNIAEVLPLLMAAPISTPSERLRGDPFDGQSYKVPPPTLPFPTGPLGPHITTEAGITSTAAIASVDIASSDPPPSSPTTKHPGAVGFTLHVTTETAARPASSTIVAATTSTQTSAVDGYAGTTSALATITSNPSSETIRTSSTTKSSNTGTPTKTSQKEGQGLPPSINPFATVALDSSNSLTAIATPISSTPTVGVPITPLTSIFAAASSSTTSAVIAVTSINALSSPTTPSTQIQTTQSTSAPTSTPLANPSSHAKTTQTIALSVCLPFLIAFLIFIAIWRRIRYREKKRADDLEKDIVWLTLRPPTPSSKATTPRKYRTKAASAARTPTRATDPAFLDGLNEVERAMVAGYQKKVADVDARRAANLTSARSPPKKNTQRRPPGGPLNSHPPNLDGGMDAPLRRRASQIFSQYHEHVVVEPATNVMPAKPSKDHIRNALSYFQPSRLSTITDKSGEGQVE